MDEKMSRLLRVREEMYHFLSRLYLFEVDETFFLQLGKFVFPKDCKNEDMTAGYEHMAAFISGHTASKKDMDILAVDYAKVFLAAGIAAGQAAFPYESVYAGTKHLVMQEAAGQMSALYAKKGLEPDTNMFKVPSDHVGLELEYMALLCREGDMGEQEVFFNTHLKNWVPVFCGEVIKYSETDFYKGLGRLTRGFMATEEELFQLVVLCEN